MQDIWWYNESCRLVKSTRCLSLILKYNIIPIWLVVWTPLKNMKQLGWLFQIYGKIKNVPKPPTSNNSYTRGKLLPVTNTRHGICSSCHPVWGILWHPKYVWYPPKNYTCEQPTILHGFKIPLHNIIQLNITKTWNNIIYHNTIPNRIWYRFKENTINNITQYENMIFYHII